MGLESSNILNPEKSRPSEHTTNSVRDHVRDRFPTKRPPGGCNHPRAGEPSDSPWCFHRESVWEVHTMPKRPEPFYVAARKIWRVQIDGRQINLGPDEETAWQCYY